MAKTITKKTKKKLPKKEIQAKAVVAELVDSQEGTSSKVASKKTLKKTPKKSAKSLPVEKLSKIDLKKESRFSENEDSFEHDSSDSSEDEPFIEPLSDFDDPSSEFSASSHQFEVNEISDEDSEEDDLEEDNSEEETGDKIRSPKKKKASSLVPTTSSSKALATADPVAVYLAEIRKYPLLSKEKEQELSQKYYESKDPMIAQILVTSNLRFVVKIAAEYSKFGARLIDLIQEGNMGLMHGVREFNPYKGVRLITYAVWWIRGYIQEYLMKQYSLVKIGTTQNQKKLFYQLQRQKAELDAMGKSPDIKTLSEKLGIPEDEVQMMVNRMSGRDISLDRPVDDDQTTRALDLQRVETAGPDDELSHREELSYLTQAIEELKPNLSEREKIILDERILADEPLTLQEIGEKYGITREAVRQMEARLMKKIKDSFVKTQIDEDAETESE